MSDPGSIPTVDDLLEHAGFVRRLASALAGDPDRARDLEQDAWLAALERPPRHGANLRAWFAAVLRNLARLDLRSRTRRRARERTTAPPAAIPGPAEMTERLEVQRRLVEAVRDLEEPCRSAVVLRYFADLGPTEIATRIGVPVRTVETRLRRGIDRLRARLDPESGGRDRSRWALLLPLFGRVRRTTTAGALTTGVLLMTGKKTAIAVLLILFAAASVAVLTRSPGAAPTPEPAGGVGTAPPGRVTGRKSVDQAAPAEVAGEALPPPVDLDAADRDRDLFGRVVGAEGEPVAGATVSATRLVWREADSGEWRFMPEPRGSTRTAADGTFRIELSPGQVVGVTVRAAGFVDFTLDSASAGEELRIALERGGSVEVRVVDSRGVPAPSADVRLAAVRDPSLGSWTRDAEPVDDRGRLRVEPVPAGELLVRARRSTDPAWASVYARVATGETTKVAITLPEEMTVSGRVLDAKSSQPIPDAVVTWGRTETTTGPDGRFRLAGAIPAGRSVKMRGAAPGYAAAARDWVGEKQVDFRLEPAGTVTGRVVDEAGDPVPGAEIHLYGAPRSPIGMTARAGDTSRYATGSDRAGRFAFRSLPADREYRLTVEARDLGEVVRTVPSGTVGDLGDVVLAPGARIDALVKDDAGRPVARTSVWLCARDPSHSPVDRPVVADGAYAFTRSRVTDDLGRVRFEGLAPGWYRLQARFRDAPEIDRDVLLPPGKDRVEVDLDMRAGRSLTVTVRDVEGRPVERARVILVGVGYLETGADGVVRFRGLPKGGFQLLVADVDRTEEPRFVDKDVFLRPGKDEVEVTVEPRREIRGRVVDPEGSPLPRLIVSVGGKSVRGWAGTEYATTDGEGRFLLARPDATAVDLVVTGQRPPPSGEGMLERTAWWGVARGVAPGTRDVVIRAARRSGPGTLPIRVVDPAGHPVPGASVAVSGSHEGTVVTDSEGRAFFGDLPDREVAITVKRPTAACLVTPSRVPAKPTGAEVTIRLRHGEWIQGVVRMPDGEPAAFVQVEATSDDGQAHDVSFTDTSGKFALVGLPGKPHRIVVGDSKGLSAEVSGVIPGGDPVEPRLR